MTQRGHVLVVDDDLVILQLIRQSLYAQGCAVTVATTGADALRSALAQPPDIILLDVMLPDADGIEICQRVRAEPLLAEVPVILITSLNDPTARLRSLEVGADDFIMKPIDFIELRARVGSILRLNRYRLLLEERTQRLRAEEKMMQRNRELLLLNSFIISTAAKLQNAHHVEESLYYACTVLVQALSLNAAEAWLLPDDGADLMVAYALANPDDEVLRPSVPEIMSYERARQLTTASVAALWTRDDTAREPISPDAAAWLQIYGDQSLLIAPIAIKSRITGAIVLLSPYDRVFGEHERAFAQSLVSAMSQAIEATLLHQQLQRHAEHLEEMVALRTNELQAERDRTQAILEALGEAVLVTDADCIIIYANPATSILTGYRNSELIGCSWCAMPHDESTTLLYKAIRDQVGRGQMWRGEVMSRRHDGTAYDTALTVAPIYDPQRANVPIGMVSIQRDITPLKAAERMKDQFISNVSHELRTPLSIITLHSGNLDTLYDRLTAEQQRRLIREVRAQAQLLDDLIGDILELSRIDSGHLSVNDWPIDLAEIMRHEVEQLRPLADRKGLRLDLQSDSGLLMQGDPAHLGQCIRNLLSNAIKFTPSGGSIFCECRRMDLGAEQLDSPEWPGFGPNDIGAWAGLRIVDTGIGIDAEHIGHLFERFYRVESQTHVPGTGLGLAITRELITRQGGWTGVASRPGAGSTFALYLPLSDDEW
ncbi:response regulator [Chloroflexales bacterium ZM16-3]|nr:response regulator [Chloroflexales bacterium ZM16-3]